MITLRVIQIVICKILTLCVNTLTANDKYSLLNKGNFKIINSYAIT